MKKKYPGTLLALRLDVLQHFVDAGVNGRTRVELARQLGIPRNTAYRVVNNLEDAGVRFAPVSGAGGDRLRVVMKKGLAQRVLNPEQATVLALVRTGKLEMSDPSVLALLDELLRAAGHAIVPDRPGLAKTATCPRKKTAKKRAKQR